MRLGDVLGIVECGTRDSEVIVIRRARLVGSVVKDWKAVWREGDAGGLLEGVCSRGEDCEYL